MTFWHRAIRFDRMKSQETSKWNVFVEISPTSKAKSISLVTSVELWDDYWSVLRQSVTESRKLSKTKQCGRRFEQLALTPSYYSRGIISDWNVASWSNHSSRNGRGCYRFGFRPALNWRCEFDHFQDDSDDCDYDGYDYAKSLQNSIEKTSQNLKVTVVPDIPSNAALRDPSFDATLASDPELDKCFQSLKQTWNTCEFEERHSFFAKTEIILSCFFLDKKGQIITNFLRQIYLSRSNPLVDGLKLYANCTENKNFNSNTLPYASM